MSAKSGDLTNEAIVSWMRFICRLIYCCGLGDCWHEPSNRSARHKIPYALYSLFVNLSVIVLIWAQIASLYKRDLTDTETADALQFSSAQTLILLKWLFISINRQRIKMLLKKLLIATRELFYDEKTERKQLRKSKLYCFGLASSLYGTIILTMIDAAIVYYKTGLPWRTMVTFYPERDDNCWSAISVRIVFTYIYLHLTTGMLATDFLAINCLISLTFKFRVLQIYFMSLKRNYEKNPLQKSQLELENEMHRDFIKGIEFHKEILWCARATQKSLGNVCSFQIVQTMIFVIICMVELVTSERNLTFLLATVLTVVCLFLLTGVYMWNAGEVTYEASLVSDAMFQSGWHLCSARAQMRKLLVVGIARSQIPVVMKAFGVVDLSYANFIKIVKNSYSIFAVLY